jgi:hypothetical protein
LVSSNRAIRKVHCGLKLFFPGSGKESFIALSCWQTTDEKALPGGRQGGRMNANLDDTFGTAETWSTVQGA